MVYITFYAIKGLLAKKVQIWEMKDSQQPAVISDGVADVPLIFKKLSDVEDHQDEVLRLKRVFESGLNCLTIIYKIQPCDRRQMTLR